MKLAPNEQKRLLRRIIRTEPQRSNRDIADDVECTVGTVRKYRKVLVK